MLLLRPTNPSMGMMLENISPRLMEQGMPHHGTSSKDPALRVATIEAAGTARVPFTTGILVGIGETREEIVSSLFTLAELSARTGAIQEVIIQNFRAKADTPMRRSAEPVPRWFARVVALARWIMGAEANVQVPPNLTESYEIYLDAGINDWGGVSPLTIDWVNPEAPWPHLDELRERTERAGFELRPRLPVYPEFIDEDWIDPVLYPAVRAAADDRGLALVTETTGAR
jgi:FO synthase